MLSAHVCHGLECGDDCLEIGHPRTGVGGGACGVQLVCHNTAVLGFIHIIRGGGIRQVAGHQGFKAAGMWNSILNPLLVLKRLYELALDIAGSSMPIAAAYECTCHLSQQSCSVV